jgi:hypothetical protein
MNNRSPIRLSTPAALLILLCAASSQAATWAPLSSGSKLRSVEVTATTNFPIPGAIAARGGAMRFTLVGGGEGGHSSRASCDDYAIQGGKGGDGGEVIEFEVTLQPGQCTAGIGAVIGPAGRGALRGGNTSTAGEPGGPTSVTCAGTVMASAMGGGRRVDAVTAPRSSKGGVGGVVMNELDQATGDTIDRRSTSITAGSSGQDGRGGYGSGGGGGGASLALSGAAVKADGTVVRRATTRNAPMGKAGYGAGTGAGPAEYSSEATFYQAENAAQYGAGGGGGAAICGGTATVRDAGNGYPGLVKIQWAE